MTPVTEPKYYKCYHCKRRHTKNEYLGYWCCDWCESRIRNSLEAHYRRYVESKVYDLTHAGTRVVAIRDKVELWIAFDYLRELFENVDESTVENEDDDDDVPTSEEIKQLISEFDIGTYNHSWLLNYQNDEWRDRILQYRIKNLGVKYEPR